MPGNQRTRINTHTFSRCRLLDYAEGIVLERASVLKELKSRYRKAKDPVLRTRLLLVWQLSQGKRTREVSEATSYNPEWIREVSRRYNEEGFEGFGDRRHRNPGGADRALLTTEQ